MLCGRVAILAVPSRLVLGALNVGNCVKNGTSVISSCLVSPLASLISDSWADVKYLLEEVALYGPAVGDLCPDHCDLVGWVAPLFVP